jgi:prophage antirepressor-like protein
MSTQKEVYDIINGLYHIKDDKDIIWFYAKELCIYLDYNDTANKIIKLYISDVSNKIKYSQINHFAGVKNTPAKIPHNAIFINEDALYELIDHSKKPNAVKFKKWTRKVLSDIRKGVIKIDDSDYKAPILMSKNNTPIFFDKSQCEDEESIFYDEDDDDIEILHKLTKYIDYKYYLNKNVLYLYTTSIKNVHNNKLIIKIGYSKQIAKRTEEHKARFGASFKLIAVREVNDIDDEQVFHQHIQFKYPELIYYFQIRNNNGKMIGAEEFYMFDYKLMEEFYDYDVEIKKIYKIITDKDIRYEELCIERLKLEIELFKLKNSNE